jgi:DNA-binding response OmpR family regulator
VTRVLVLEDEERYREVVCRYLSLQGHEVRDTASGEEAIALGLAQGPDVLVADWMLRHSVHGLHVAEALRVADPALHTVLVTGFPASDVTADPGRVGISEILEKPFDVEALGGAVRRAAEAGRAAREAGDAAEAEVVGVLRCDADGTVVHRNHAARALLAEAPGGAEAPDLASLFPEGLLAEADTRWVEAPPALVGEAGLWLRRRTLGDEDAQVVLLCAAGQGWRRQDPRVRMLLGQRLGAAAADGAFRDAMLLVDDSAQVRDTFVAQLAHRGCPARTAGRHSDAIDVFRTDPRIRVVVLDWAMPGEDLRTTVARLREIRPEVRLVGTSGEDRSAEFAELGIDDFLLKPWTVAGELAALLGDDVTSSRGGTRE